MACHSLPRIHPAAEHRREIEAAEKRLDSQTEESFLDWMRYALALAFIFLAVAAANAQSNRRSFEFYRAEFEKYLGKDITLDATNAKRQDTGEFGDVALFLVYTGGYSSGSYAYVAVPLAEVEAFAKRYASKDGSYVFYDKDMRQLRGKLAKGMPRSAAGVVWGYSTGDLYISYEDALLPDKPASDVVSEARASAAAEKPSEGSQRQPADP